MKQIFVFGMLAAAGMAQAQVFSNGPVVDGSGLSILASGIDSTLGAGSNASAALADNFTVGAGGWNVTGLSFYGYQTGATAYTFTNVTWSIRAGADVNTAASVASGVTASTSGGLVGYRVTTTTLTNTQRPIFQINVDVPDLVLAPGSYFVTWQLAGTSASGPFVPPVLGSLGTGNALQSLLPAPFTPLADGLSLSSFDVPFQIQGSVVPEPATYALLLAGGAAVVSAARRRRQG